jgi:hypothetical protein
MIKKSLRIITLTAMLGTIALWLEGGANRGWTKTSVATMKIDPITQIEYPVWRKEFVPGVDFLVAGIGLAIVLGGASLLPIFNPTTTKKDT